MEALEGAQLAPKRGDSQETVVVHAADSGMPDWCHDWVPNATPGLGSHYVQHCLLPDDDTHQADPRPDDDAAKDHQKKRWADGAPAVKVVADLIEAESETDLLDVEDQRDVDRYNDYMERKLETLRAIFAASDDEQDDVVSGEEDLLDAVLRQRLKDHTVETASTMGSMRGPE